MLAKYLVFFTTDGRLSHDFNRPAPFSYTVLSVSLGWELEILRGKSPLTR
jgi:hypothetical protein